MKIINFCPITTFCEQTHINSEDDPTLYLVRTISGRVEVVTGTEIMTDMADGQFIAEFYPLPLQWHYPSKGDYPPSMEKYCGRSEPVLVWLGDNNVEYAQWIEEAKTWGRGICELTGTVIAWKYIELPKEV